MFGLRFIEDSTSLDSGKWMAFNGGRPGVYPKDHRCFSETPCYPFATRESAENYRDNCTYLTNFLEVVEGPRDGR